METFNSTPTWSNGSPEKLTETARSLEQALISMRVVDSALLRTYYQSPDVQVDAIAIGTGDLASGLNALKKRSQFNLLRSTVDAYAAQVAGNLPTVDVSTTGGSWSQRRSAEALSLFVEGVMAGSDVHKLAWQCTVDSCLSRVAAVKVEVEADAIKITRVAPHEILWNPAAGATPRELVTRTSVPRSALLAKYGDDSEKRAAIEAAAPFRPDPLFDGIDGYWADQLPSDMVELVEGWRTAEPGDPTTGRYVAQVRSWGGGTGVLEDKEYPHTFHAIVPLRHSPSYSSFAGSPAGDLLIAYQAELDDFSSVIKEQFVKGAVLRVWMETGHAVSPKQLNNINGAVVEHAPGKKPVMDHGVAPTPEYMAREDVIIRRAFEFLGLNVDQARGQKADGVNSAVGQRTVVSIAQGRLVLHLQNFQDWLVAIARTIVAIADAHFDGKHDISVKVPGNRLLRRIKWSEIDYKQDNFEFSCDAVNALSHLPGARIEEILELVQAKVIDEKQALKLIGVKDLQAAKDQAFASIDFAEKIIDLALDGDLRQPDPYLGVSGLQTLIDRGTERYLAEMVQDEPSEYLYLLRRLIEAGKTVLAQLQAPPANSQTDIAPAAEAPAELPPDLAVPGAGLPAELPAAAEAPPVPGAGLATA